MKWNGLDIRIEVDKGGMRSGKTPSGKRWSIAMPCAYGHIPSTEGDDGEEVDIFVGPNPSAPHVFAINQKDAETGEHDEQKIMLGFDNETEAAKTYVACFSDGKGKDRLGKMMRLSVDDFKEQIKDLRVAKAYAAGGTVGYDTPSVTAYDVARTLHGQREGRANALLNKFLSGNTQGMTSDEYAWCSRFVKQSAIKAGVDPAALKGVDDSARSWLRAGEAVDKPQQGDIVVMSRGDPDGPLGHVGFYAGKGVDGSVRVLAGNEGDAVAYGSYPESRVLGYRRLGPGSGFPNSDPISDTAVAENPHTPSRPLREGWGEGAGLHLLKEVASWKDPEVRAPSAPRLSGGSGGLRMAAEAMPYGGSIEELTGMPYKAPQKKADGGPAELRSYTPTLGDRVNEGLDAIGGVFGYDDLPERTAETLDLISIPAMAAPVLGPSMRQIGMLRAGEAGRDLGIADSIMRYSPSETTVAKGSEIANRAARTSFQRKNARTAGDADDYIRAAFPEKVKRSATQDDYGLPAAIPSSPVANLNKGGPQSVKYDQALYNARKPSLDIIPGGKKADGGPVGPAGPSPGEPLVRGPLRSPHMGAGGRTDTLPISVRSGAFVFPADIVSALGENNTEHGYRVLEEMFAESRASRGKATGQEKSEAGDYESPAERVPIIAAEGEFVADPEDVAWAGGGDLERGHKVLEKLVLRIRQQHIDDLKNLPRPHR